ncbi:MAG: O-antigen ligase family protein [bacterium]|nr:O-antigen ligase family protein [bacterium]
MKKRNREKEQKEKRVSPYNGFIIISICIFVFFRFFVDGLSYPVYNFIWNIYFFLLTITHILIKNFKIELDKTSILLLLYFTISSISTGISPIKGTGVGFNAQILAYWCIFFLVKEVFKTVDEKKILLFTIIISGFLICIYGIDQYFFGLKQTKEFIYSRPELLKTLPPTFLERIQSNRVFATFIYPNIFASFLLFLIPLSFFLSISRERIILRVIAMATLILSLWNIFLTGSSGGIYILLFVLQIITIFLIFDTRRLRIILPALIIFEMLFMYGGYTAGKLPKMSSFVDRVNYWKAATTVFKEHPLVGVGPENYKYYYLKYKTPGAMEAKHPHSIFFASLAETGIVGTFFLFAFFITIGINLFTNAKVSMLEAGVSFSFLSFLLHNFIDFNFINPAVAVLFFIGGGLASTNPKENKFNRYRSLTDGVNFLIILLLIFTTIEYTRFSLSQREMALSEEESDINTKLYYIEKAGKLYGNNFEIYEKKGDIFYTIFTFKKELIYKQQAEILYLQAINLNPLLISCYRKLAFLYEATGDYKDAERMYLKVLKLYPDKKQYNIEMALFYKKTGDEDRFRYYYEKSKGLNAVSVEEGMVIEGYEKWIESLK